MSFLNIFSKNLIINYLILFIPIAYIAGNLVLNLNILLLIFFSFLFFKGDIFRIKYDIIDKLILLLFIYILLNGFFNNLLNFEFPTAPSQNIVIMKSIFFLRFLILYLVIRFLVLKELINYKLLFFVYGLCALLVSFDLIIQFIFGKNLLGMEGEGRRLAGVFGDEPVAGGFIQKFFIFLPYAILLFSGIKNKFYFQLTILLILSISLFGVLVSGNRVPLFFSIFALPLIFIFEKKFRKIIGSAFIILLISFVILLKSSSETYNHFHDFQNKSTQFLSYFQEKFSSSGNIIIANVYIKEFESGISTWQQNKTFGGGIKSFYFHCSSIKKDIMTRYIGSCNSHPHNYYLEIAASLGVVGLFLLIIIFFIILTKSLALLHFSNSMPKIRKIFIPFFIIFVLEIFPLKTTGSFFTTTNGNILFIILAFIVGLIEFNKIKNNYEKE